MVKVKFFDAFLVGFLPEEYQKSFWEKSNIKTPHMAYLSSLFIILLSLIFLFSFYGFYLKFTPGKFWILLITIFFSIFILDGFLRIILKIFKKDYGAFPFSIINLYLSKFKKSNEFNDEIMEVKNLLIIHSPCPKPHWVQWGGINYKDKSFKISKQLKLEISHFFKFEPSEEKYPAYDLEKEKNYNIASDFSIILSPLWGFLPEKFQYSLLKYERYNLKYYFYFSLILTFFVSFPSMIFDLIRFMQKREVIYFILPHFLISLYFVYESVMRFFYFITERKIKGSLIAFFVKPLYYMIYGEFL